jgi:hypothetical protein
MKKSPLNDAKWANRDPGTNMTQKEKLENRDLFTKKTTLGNDLIRGYLDFDGDGKVKPWELGVEAASWMLGGAVGKLALKGLGKGFKLVKGALKRESSSPFNHCDSEMMHSGGWGQVRKYNSPGTTGNKEAITHNKKIMNKIGTFNMPHSPLNKGHEVNKDSIASQKAWKDHKADYLKKENGQKEYDMEKGEFFYSPKHNKLKLIPTDDGEVQDRSGIEKWQLAPDRKSSDSSPLDCWKGYERVPGTKEFSDGSCRKKGSPAKQKMVTGENTSKIQTDERGEYSLVMDETQQGLKVNDTIRPSNNKFFKPAILGKSLGSKDGYLIGGDYDIEETGDKNYILKNK